MPTDLEFAVYCAEKFGTEIQRLRTIGGRRKKLDRTDVTDADEQINRTFIQAVTKREGPGTAVHGEEASRKVRGARRVWVIDPVDGTGEYVDDSMPDHLRTTCVGLSLFVNGQLKLSVVKNPFRGELFTAEADGRTYLNGRAVTCGSGRARRGMAYDYSYWNGASFDVRGLEQTIGKPRGDYSAIYQAAMVAVGRSGFAVFPGNTIHDIAPGALLVLRAGGRVSDLKGRPLNWRDLNHGVLFASRTTQTGALREISAL